MVLHNDKHALCSLFWVGPKYASTVNILWSAIGVAGKCSVSSV